MWRLPDPDGGAHDWVPIAVLRAWEKRYGVPHPSRTDAAYRMYTEPDVTMVRRLKRVASIGSSCVRGGQHGVDKLPWVVGGAGVVSILPEVLVHGGRVLPASIEAQKSWLEAVIQGLGTGHRL